MSYRFKLYIFDLDDTLYNEHDYVYQAFRNVAKYLSEYVTDDEDFLYKKMLECLEKNGRGKIFDTIIEESSFYQGCSVTVGELVKVYRATKPSLFLYDDARIFLEGIKEHNNANPDNIIRTGIITDGCSIVQHNKINGLNISDFFDEIIVTDDFENAAKPSTIPYKIFLDKYRDIKPMECVYIGDNPSKDFVGAKALNMHTIRIIREQGDNMKLVVEADKEAHERVNLLTDI